MASIENLPESQPASVRDEIQRLLKAGTMFFNHNQDAQALPLFKKAYVLCRGTLEPCLQAKCLFNLGATYVSTGKPQKGLKCLWKAQETGGEGGDGDLYFNIGAAYDDLKEYRKAAAFYQKAILEYHTCQTRSTADALIKMAYCLADAGDVASAAHSFRQAGLTYRKLQLPEDAAMAMREAANYLLRSPTFSQEDVLEILQICGHLCTEMNNQELLSKLHNHVGLHYAEIRCFNQAELHFLKALELCTGEYFTIRKRAVLLQNMGAVYNALEQFEKSLQYHSEAADMYGALREWTAQAQCLYNLATAHFQLKSYHTAEFYYQRALASFAEAGDTYSTAQAYEGLGATHLSLDHFDHATYYYKQALGLFEKSKETSEIPCRRIQAKLADIAKGQGSSQHRRFHSE